MNVERIERTIFNIQNRLLDNEDLLKLLYYSNPNPLSNGPVPLGVKEKLITLSPIFKYGPESSINNFISLGLPQVDDTDNGIIINFDLAVFCNSSYWVLDDRKVRVMQIIKEVQKTLENKNFNTSGVLLITGLEPAILDDLGFAGYYVSAKLVDNTQEIEL